MTSLPLPLTPPGFRVCRLFFSPSPRFQLLFSTPNVKATSRADVQLPPVRPLRSRSWGGHKALARVPCLLAGIPSMRR